MDLKYSNKIPIFYYIQNKEVNMTPMEKIIALCDYLTTTWNPTDLRWGWGEALFTYALCELDSFRGKDRYLHFYKAYCDKYAENLPVVDCSDRAAPALTAFYLYQKTGEKKYKKLTDLALDYIRNSKKIIGDIPNHFGFSSDAGYPQSIWVDSLMMFSYFTAYYGKAVGDEYMLDYAARQPEVFASLLMDEKCGCWYHSYWVEEKTHYPKRKLFWGRGNGWVALSYPMIFEKIGKDNEHANNILSIYKKSIDGILSYRRKDGAFNTIINKKTSYRELSATALISAGIFQGVRLGMLDEKYLNQGYKAYNCCLDSLIFDKNGGVFFPEISRPTVPMQVIPELWYRLLPRGKNWNYGVAALIFAAIQEAKLSA